MNSAMQRAQEQLAELLEHYAATAGMSIRDHGDHLILGRPDAKAASRKSHDNDRMRLTRLSTRTYGVSVNATLGVGKDPLRR